MSDSRQGIYIQDDQEAQQDADYYQGKDQREPGKDYVASMSSVARYSASGPAQ
jgi:hypothetical protein